MAIETVILAQRQGEPVQGTAEVTRYGAGARAARAWGLAIGGTVLGAASILVPGLHFVSTWLLPMLAIGLALYVVRIRARVGGITGVCPRCGEPMNVDSPGAVADEAVWVRCDQCMHPLELRLPESG